MATKGSTSGQSIDKIREREAARRMDRLARKRQSQMSPVSKSEAVTGFRTLILEIRDRSKDNLQICYQRLDVLIPYYRKFKYHEHKQKAVMEGRIVLTEIPGELYTRILSSVSAEKKGWVQGSMAKSEPEIGRAGS